MDDSPYVLRDGARVRIRPATVEDVPDIHTYISALGALGRGFRFDKASPMNRDCVTKMVERERPLIALDTNGNVIGEASYLADPYKNPEFRDWATIAMSVAPRWRRRGVGTTLLRDLTDRARAEGVRLFAITTHHRNRPVITWARSRGAEQLDDVEKHWHEFVAGI